VELLASVVEADMTDNCWNSRLADYIPCHHMSQSVVVGHKRFGHMNLEAADMVVASVHSCKFFDLSMRV
jgi:hypothetical protein